jgi:hypothetical protein
LVWNRALDPTGNDTDVDGDNLPDQRHTIPHGLLTSTGNPGGSTAVPLPEAAAALLPPAEVRRPAVLGQAASPGDAALPGEGFGVAATPDREPGPHSALPFLSPTAGPTAGGPVRPLPETPKVVLDRLFADVEVDPAALTINDVLGT